MPHNAALQRDDVFEPLHQSITKTLVQEQYWIQKQKRTAGCLYTPDTVRLHWLGAVGQKILESRCRSAPLHGFLLWPLEQAGSGTVILWHLEPAINQAIFQHHHKCPSLVSSSEFKRGQITFRVFLLLAWADRCVGGCCRCIRCRKSSFTACWDIRSWNWSNNWQRLLKVKLLSFSYEERRRKNEWHVCRVFFDLAYESVTIQKIHKSWFLFYTSFLTTRFWMWLGHIHLPVGKAVRGGSKQSIWNKRGQ